MCQESPKKMRTFGGHECGPLMAISADFLVAMDTPEKGLLLRWWVTGWKV